MTLGAPSATSDHKIQHLSHTCLASSQHVTNQRLPKCNCKANIGKLSMFCPPHLHVMQRWTTVKKASRDTPSARQSDEIELFTTTRIHVLFESSKKCIYACYASGHSNQRGTQYRGEEQAAHRQRQPLLLSTTVRHTCRWKLSLAANGTVQVCSHAITAGLRPLLHTACQVCRNLTSEQTGFIANNHKS
jgi:hypothetical protein